MRFMDRPAAMAAMLLLSLAGCGGGGGDAGSGGSGSQPLNCSVAEQQRWLGNYMDEWYFWYRLAPRPAASSFPDVDSYLQARLHAGGAGFPADRWSRSESEQAHDLFYQEGATVGYGVSVAGQEVLGSPGAPLYVRGVEPLSPAGRAGVARGDQVLALNGRTSVDLIAANDFGALSATRAGESLNLRLRRGGVERSVTLTAAEYTLTPVGAPAVLNSPRGRKLGYLAVKDMISQALPPLETAFAGFRSAGVNDVVIDLRYNGGGLVSTGATLASYLAGTRGGGQPYARLLYNDRRAATNNQDFPFTLPPSALNLPRAIVLTGSRTCSASEQVINGLLGVGVQVLSVGGGTCGKPVGFLPESACGRTYSIVNFESVNARNEGRYFNGFDPVCPVAENFSTAQGGPDDPLMKAALTLADGGSCPAASASEQPQARSLARRTARPEPGERRDMIPR